MIIKTMLIFLFAALIWFLVSGYRETQESVKLYNLLEEVGVLTESEVVEIKEAKHDNLQKSFTYTYSYTFIVNYEVLGQYYALQSVTASKNPDDLPQIGTKISVLYNPQKPEEAIFAKDYGDTEIESKRTILLALKAIISVLVIALLVVIILLIRPLFF